MHRSGHPRVCAFNLRSAGDEGASGHLRVVCEGSQALQAGRARVLGVLMRVAGSRLELRSKHQRPVGWVLQQVVQHPSAEAQHLHGTRELAQPHPPAANAQATGT